MLWGSLRILCLLLGISVTFFFEFLVYNHIFHYTVADFYVFLLSWLTLISRLYDPSVPCGRENIAVQSCKVISPVDLLHLLIPSLLLLSVKDNWLCRVSASWAWNFSCFLANHTNRIHVLSWLFRGKDVPGKLHPIASLLFGIHFCDMTWANCLIQWHDHCSWMRIHVIACYSLISPGLQAC